MKYASVYERSGKVFIRSMDKTVAGYHLGQDNFVSRPIADLGGIGAAVRAALEASREGIAERRYEANAAEDSALYPLAGVRNWREFAKGARSISVDHDDGQIKLIPWRNEGARANFTPIKGHDRLLSDLSADAEIGAAVIATLADAV